MTGICRDTSVELEDIAEQVISGIDLTATKAIEAVGSLVEQLIDGPVHILINNAGILATKLWMI